ncbi:cyclic AMP-responsive element-binding protein 3-like protein 3-A [Lampris incognitus]|uniref:cyclic AMP-responsive element-binding protein 3-like protein 3-A n=1 Tax=Lampris incognitus TaxID=2546036 RepID=UPI0024B5B703|nr:cyclic AMP-responsive element-binding protein 3-like protein 3-A [Lampris incognitus]
MMQISDEIHDGIEFFDLLVNSTNEAADSHGDQPWTITIYDSLNPEGGGADDFLDNLLGGSDSSSVPASPLWSPSASDSGLSEDPLSDHPVSPHPPPSSPFPAFHCRSHPQTYPTAGHAAGEPALSDMAPDISIDLGWDSNDHQEKLGIAYYLSTNPTSPLSSCHALTIKDLLLCNLGKKAQRNSQHSLQELVLNEDEKKLLAKEGVNLPTKLPLSKSEERVLKKIRRKIRNKHSAQESRKKKREYVDSLEGRMAACSAHNLELQRKVHQLEQTNNSLLEQLSRLQARLPHSSSKTTQKGTCILVLLLSFSLILSPTLQPHPNSLLSQEEYAEAKVPSRLMHSVVEPEEVTPSVLSVYRGMDVLSCLIEKLWSGTKLADTDFQTIHYEDHSR